MIFFLIFSIVTQSDLMIHLFKYRIRFKLLGYFKIKFSKELIFTKANMYEKLIARRKKFLKDLYKS